MGIVFFIPVTLFDNSVQRSLNEKELNKNNIIDYMKRMINQLLLKE